LPTYAVGDIQGCCRELHDLLDRLNFDRRRDRLWFTGDLVNRGPQSLETLRLVRSLGDDAVTVLGNHDLHLLGVAGRHVTPKKKDTFGDVLKARDCRTLLDWLRRLPLLHHDEDLGWTMVHAGLPPQWDLAQAAELAGEVQAVLRSDAPGTFLQGMYGDQPARWDRKLRGIPRLRFITNCLTRMRYCTSGGTLSMREKGPPGSQPKRLLPWYAVPKRASRKAKIIFGHWSTVHLNGAKGFRRSGVYPLDTGCVWGGSLSALRLEDGKLFSVPSRQPSRSGE
jgi:bis(5'-nucleosyl)-tetraphosphatase (symmetrical)